MSGVIKCNRCPLVVIFATILVLTVLVLVRFLPQALSMSLARTRYYILG